MSKKMSHKYQLKQGEKQYIFQTIVEGTSIILSIETPEKKVLTRELSVLGLSALDNVFAQVKTAEEGLDLIDKVLKDHKIKVKGENQNIKIILYITANDVTNQIEIPFGDENSGLTKLTEEEILRNVRRSSRLGTNIDISNINVENTTTEQIPIETKVETNLEQNTDINLINTNNENPEVNLDNIDVNLNQESSEKIETNVANDVVQIPENVNVVDTNINMNMDIASNIEIPQTIETTTTETETNVNTNINYDKILPEQVLPPKMLEENDTQNFIPPTETQTQTQLETKEYTATNTLIQNDIQTSEVPVENYFNNNIETNLDNNINIVPNVSVPEKKDEISSLIDELTKLKNREIEELKIQVDKMLRMSKQNNNFDLLKQKEQENYLLKKQLEESIKNQKQYELKIKSLRASQTQAQIQRTSQGLERQNITFEEKAQHICVKGDILHSAQELELITRKINNKLNNKNSKLTLNLLYKATADSDKASAFHEKCDKANRTIVLIETDKGKRFGGYTSMSWKGEAEEKNDEEAFVFSLDKMKTYDNIPGELAIGCYPKFGPIFMGCQIRIYDDAFVKGGTTFEKGLNYNTEEDFELNGGEKNFIVKEIEVYGVIPQ